MPGRADYCVYWFRHTHDELRKGGRAGLVGTNTIRQNYSRQGGLDYIVGNGGTIVEAVSTQVWPGEAAVHVSIVNWVKSSSPGRKKLSAQIGDHLDSPFEVYEVERINSSLSPLFDVCAAVPLLANTEVKTCFQGQTHGHEGFLMTRREAEAEIARDAESADVLFPYLTIDELLGAKGNPIGRYVIDFGKRSVHEAQGYPRLFGRVHDLVLPDRKRAAEKEGDRNEEALKESEEARINRHHTNFLDTWWQLSYRRAEMTAAVAGLFRYIACGRVTKRPIFEFLSSRIRANDALMVFAFEDDYSFGVLQSAFHWDWFRARCSTLKGDFRYTADTVYDSFPWPQAPTAAVVRCVGAAGVALRARRRELMARHGMSLRDLYRTLELPGQNALRDAHGDLDDAVRAAYGMRPGRDRLEFLFHLNEQAARAEASLRRAQGPGLPRMRRRGADVVSRDCIMP